MVTQTRRECQNVFMISTEERERERDKQIVESQVGVGARTFATSKHKHRRGRVSDRPTDRHDGILATGLPLSARTSAERSVGGPTGGPTRRKVLVTCQEERGGGWGGKEREMDG